MKPIHPLPVDQNRGTITVSMPIMGGKLVFRKYYLENIIKGLA
jgi:hypothetical protein